jgi:hypothetical protein
MGEPAAGRSGGTRLRPRSDDRGVACGVCRSFQFCFVVCGTWARRSGVGVAGREALCGSPGQLGRGLSAGARLPGEAGTLPAPAQATLPAAGSCSDGGEPATERRAAQLFSRDGAGARPSLEGTARARARGEPPGKVGSSSASPRSNEPWARGVPPALPSSESPPSAADCGASGRSSVGAVPPLETRLATPAAAEPSTPPAVAQKDGGAATARGARGACDTAQVSQCCAARAPRGGEAADALGSEEASGRGAIRFDKPSHEPWREGTGEAAPDEGPLAAERPHDECREKPCVALNCGRDGSCGGAGTVGIRGVETKERWRRDGGGGARVPGAET